MLSQKNKILKKPFLTETPKSLNITTFSLRAAQANNVSGREMLFEFLRDDPPWVASVLIHLDLFVLQKSASLTLGGGG
jgi:hypothetical protein